MKQAHIILFFIYLLLFTDKSFSQIFIRIYNEAGKKIGKGTIINASDTSIEVMNDNESKIFWIYEIAYIKTKRSLGASIATGVATGTIISALITKGLMEGDDNISNKEWRIIGTTIVSGLVAGTISGGVAGVVTKRKKIFIGNSVEKWKTARDKLLPPLPDKYHLLQ
jgi:hypothetical protein